MEFVVRFNTENSHRNSVSLKKNFFLNFLLVLLATLDSLPQLLHILSPCVSGTAPSMAPPCLGKAGQPLGRLVLLQAVSQAEQWSMWFRDSLYSRDWEFYGSKKWNKIAKSSALTKSLGLLDTCSLDIVYLTSSAVFLNNLGSIISVIVSF